MRQPFCLLRGLKILNGMYRIHTNIGLGKRNIYVKNDDNHLRSLAIIVI